MDRYCMISEWMAKKHNLSGLSLIVYAILYRPSQDRFSCFVDYDFIKTCTGLLRDETNRILKHFKERGMIDWDGSFYKTINKD